ncbi:phosphoketolase [Tenggerimyces flavus]|nr:phosphoketolase [Tenggerimyces flavus]
MELVRRFSVPGGFPSHLSPAVPGVIHEGGELGYALATAFGAAFDAPDRLVACVVGDGEAETGPTATAWHGTKHLDPATSGAVLPILHLNRYKIASPTLFATMTDSELTALFRGYGWRPILLDVETTGRAAAGDPDAALAAALGDAYTEIRGIQDDARSSRPRQRPAWPMLVVKSPKGWGGIDDLDRHPVTGTFYAHQVPAPNVHDDPEQLAALERWLRSYRPEELFDADGRPAADILACCPVGDQRLGAQPAANGGRLRVPLLLPSLEPFAPPSPTPGQSDASPTGPLGEWLAAVMRATEERRDFRIVCPDELESNKLGAVLSASPRAYAWPVDLYAEHVAPGGRVMEKLSEHDCQGWLQGYLLTGRHGLFPCYEAFVQIVDGMVNQYAKFLKMAGEVPWRAPVSSLTYLLTSEGWQQEHNGYSHQGPGFLNQLLTKKGSVARIYLPPDASTLLVTMEHCLQSTNRINAVVASKHPAPVWLDLTAARRHCEAGAAPWGWAGTVADGESADVVLACAGGVPTIETLAAAQLLRADVPDLAFAVVNVVDRSRSFTRTGWPRRGSAAASATTPRWCSTSTATRRRSTNSCTDAPAQTGSTCAATSKRAPQPRRSTCSLPTK